MKIKFVGGYSEVGKNMTLIEVGSESVIIDMGLYLPAVVNYLEGNINKLNKDELIEIGAIPDDNGVDNNEVKGIIFGHAHLDHIGAAPYLAKKYKCDMFGTPYTIGVLKTLFEDKKLNPRNKFIDVKFNSKYKLSKNFSFEFRHMTHSIVDAALTVLYTIEGKIAYSNDYKVDYKPVLMDPFSDKYFEELKPVKLLFLDSLYGDTPDRTPSESKAREMLKEEFIKLKGSKNAIIVTTFASHISRLRSIVDYGRTLGRKIVFLGRSMYKYVGVAKELNIVDFIDVDLVGYRNIINKKLKEINKNRDKYIVVCTGNQGEAGSVLVRMAQDETPFEFKSGDVVLFSSRTIPTIETIESREKLEGILKGRNVTMIKDIHVSGHGHQEDAEILIKVLRPEHIILSHGPPEKIKGNKSVALRLGYDDEHVHIVRDGDILEI